MRDVILFLMMLVSLNGGEYVVVISQKTSIDAVSKTLLKDIYLKKKSFIDGIKMVPINLSPQHAIRTQFEAVVLEMDREELNGYWIEQHYHGIRPPITQKSPKSLKAFLDSVEGSIGYLPKSQSDATLRVLYEF